MAAMAESFENVCSKVLRIDDLNVVYDKVKPIAARWKQFANSLYIRPDTIDIIEADCSSSSESCLHKVLGHWLRKDYNYKFYGSPCWRRVCVAVQGGGGDTALAEDIAHEHPLSASTGGESTTENSVCSVLALGIFNTHRPLLSQSLSDPVSVARLLNGEGVITGQVLASVESASPSVPNQREVLLAAIVVAIQSKYSSLQTFASVLCRFSGNLKLGTVIQKDYDQHFSNDEFVNVQIKEGTSSTGTITSSQSSPHTPTTPTVEIAILKSKSGEFNSMRASLGSMLYNVHKAILKATSSLGDMKLLILSCNSGLKSKLDNCHDVSSVIDVIKEECSLTDISLLETVVEEFEVTEAEGYIEHYKTTLEEFCDTMSIDLCLKEKFDAVNTSHSLKCEEVTYVFDWRPDEKKLKDITEILSKTSGKFVKIKYIDTGYSIVVTCSFPHSLTGALIIKLSENLELLIKNGLVKLTVGYCTIWKKQEVEVLEIKEKPHDDTKRQKELKETAQQLKNMLSEKEKELNRMKQKIQELSLLKTTKEERYEMEFNLAKLKKITNKRMKGEYRGSLTDSTSAQYKIGRAMKMEIEKLKNETDLLDQNEVKDNKKEIAELQEQISLMSVHILNKREENEELMYKIKDYKSNTLKLDQEISSEQILDKMEENQQVFHQEIKELLDQLIISVESHQTKTLVTSQYHAQTTRAAMAESFESVCNKVLCIDDLNVVYDKVKPIAARWKQFANSLYIRPATIDIIEADCGSSSELCLHKVLGHWLRKDYNYEFFGSPCWRRVCVAVKEGGGDTALAEDIAREHPLPASTGGESTTDASVYAFPVRDGRLLNEIHELQLEFSDILKETRDAFKPELLPNIIDYLETHVSTLLGPSNNYLDEMQEIRKEFSNIETIKDFFMVLQQKYISWFNYGLIVKLVDVFLPNNRSLKRTWSGYKEKLKDYFLNSGGLLTDANALEFGIKDVPPGTRVMIAKVDRDDYTPADLFFFRRAIPKELNIPNVKLYFSFVRIG